MKELKKVYRTDAEWKKEHDGHIYTISWSGVVGDAKCKTCRTTEKVVITDKICEKHEYGQHIKIRCKKCGAEGTTKNIDYIGARSLFLPCKCKLEDYPEYEHICED